MERCDKENLLVKGIDLKAVRRLGKGIYYEKNKEMDIYNIDDNVIFGWVCK